jgi:hypothetical protein
VLELRLDIDISIDLEIERSENEHAWLDVGLGRSVPRLGENRRRSASACGFVYHNCTRRSNRGEDNGYIAVATERMLLAINSPPRIIAPDLTTSDTRLQSSVISEDS